MKWLLACALYALPARADRGLLEPNAGEVRAGERLRVELEAPHGLTPPPGIQNERALRGFAARACAQAACIPLPAVDVRPRDGWSFVYRAEFAVPSELAAGPYRLDVRFPGGLSSGRLLVKESAPVPARAASTASGCAVAASPAHGAPLGLLLVALSRKLGAARRARSRSGNSPR